MRIVAGTHRGRRLLAPKGATTRPTSDRARESVFQHIEAAIRPFTSARVLDLFAGSGALGLEALSRGASSATFVDRDRKALAAIRTNIAALDLAEQTRVVAGALPQSLKRAGSNFDIVFCDPPYAWDGAGGLLGAIAAHSVAAAALVVYEHSTARPVDVPPQWAVISERRVGEAGFTILRLQP